VKQTTESLHLPEGYELGTVPADQIDLVLASSKVKRQPDTYLALPNVAVFMSSLQNTEKTLVAWAYLSIDKSLGTLYVLPEHRGRGLAKMAAAKILRDLYEGVAGPEKAQSDWCCAQVSSDNAESQGVCRSLGARLTGRITFMTIDLDKLFF
jgi:GNAT superfamily N-acetyltransferase